MTICHINLAADYRGGERQTELLVRELARRGWPQRLVIRHGQQLAKRCDDVDRLAIAATSSNLIAAGRATRGSSLVHAHEARGVYAGWYARLFYRIPYLLTRRVVRPQKASWIRDRAYRSAGAIVAISKAVATHVKQSYPDIEAEIVSDAYADLPIDAEVATGIRHRYADKVVIGHIGTYDHSAKGQLTIIEVAKRAAREKPDWHFLLLGAGREEDLFRERIGALTNIELVGFVDNVGDYLSAFDVFIFPSLHEALGSSVLDAMRFGLPIVATAVGGIPEFVIDGRNGILVSPEAPEQLMAGIAKIVDDPVLAGQMNIENRARAADFSVERMADAYEAIYNRILKSA